MQKTAFLLMAITILSKVLGFGRELVMANYYGITAVADAFIVAFTIPSVIFNFLGTGVMTGYIPMYSKIEKEQGKEGVFRFTSNLVNMLMVVAIVLCILGIIFAKQLVLLFAWGFSGEKLAIAEYFTRFFMMSILGAAFSSVFRGFLNQNDNFIVPATTGFIMNVFTITAIALSAMQNNLMILALGTGLAQIFQYVFFIPSIKKTGYVHSWHVDKNDANIKHLALLALPIIMGVAVSDINTLIDRALASIVASNGVSVLNYANRLYGFVTGIVIVSISTAIFPTLSRMAADRKVKEMKRTFTRSISMMNLLVLPAVVGFMLYAVPIVDLLFRRGKFDEEAVRLVAGALFMYSPSLIGIAYRDILSRMFYAMHDTRTPAVNAFITVVLNVVFSVALAQFMGLNGLALGTTIATLIGAFILMQILRVRLRGLTLSGIFKSSVKITFSALLMGAVSYAFHVFTAELIKSSTIHIFATILVAVVVYAGAILVLRVDEGKMLIELVTKRIRK